MTANIVRYLWLVSWQTAVLTGVVWIITRIAKKTPASWRYAMWVIVVAKFLVPPFAYLPSEVAVWQKQKPADIHEVYAIPESQSPIPTQQVSRSATPAKTVATSEIKPEPKETAQTVLVLAWLIGATMMVGVLLVRWFGLSRLVRKSIPSDDYIRSILSECTNRLGLKHAPLIMSSSQVRIPLLAGLLRPTILLPCGMETSFTKTEISAIILHELAHIRRRDTLVMWLQHLVQSIYFFHPAVWLVNKIIRHEREVACDEFVLSTKAISPEDYAEGYISVLKLAIRNRLHSPSLAMAEPFNVEHRRLQMILRNAVPNLSKRSLLVLILMAALGIPTFVGIRTISAGNASDMPTIEGIVFALREQEAAREGSMDVTYGVDTTIIKGSGKPGSGQVVHYIWTPTGFRTERGDANKDKPGTAYSAQNNEMRLLETGPDQAPTGKISSWNSPGGCYIDSGLMETTAAGLVGKPLYKALENGIVDPTPETIDGYECWKVVAESEGSKLTAWCDAAIGYAPRQLEQTSEGIRTTITFIDYRQVREGFWFPMQMEKRFEFDHNTQEMTQHSTVKSIEAGKTVSPAELQVEFPKGTHVKDELNDSDYTVE